MSFVASLDIVSFPAALFTMAIKPRIAPRRADHRKTKRVHFARGSIGEHFVVTQKSRAERGLEEENEIHISLTIDARSLSIRSLWSLDKY